MVISSMVSRNNIQRSNILRVLGQKWCKSEVPEHQVVYFILSIIRTCSSISRFDDNIIETLPDPHYFWDSQTKNKQSSINENLAR